jgi:MFS superfamily sulfate permease-like transporter
LSQIGAALGLPNALGTSFFDKVNGIANQLGHISLAAIGITAVTFVITKYGLKISPFLPAPLIGLGAATLLAKGLGFDLKTIGDVYGTIPTDFFVITLPGLPEISGKVLFDVLYFSLAIVFVSAVESLLCSSMADRLANNKGQPFNPNKELWGQGWVQIIIPLLNGFPHTGALARTATNIRLGAISPLAGIFKCFLKLAMAAFLAVYLEQVPMACVAGVLIYVSTAMVKPAEIALVRQSIPLDRWIMVYTAIAVPVTDFLTGVISALVLHAVLKRFGIGTTERTLAKPLTETVTE